MKKYENPELELLLLYSSDVVTASDETYVDGDENLNDDPF